MKALVIGGQPATGKTTLVRALLGQLEPSAAFKFGLLRGFHYKECSVLGVYREGDAFAGTDRLSMSVQRHYEQFIARCRYPILFEGDRLFTKKNLISLCSLYDAKVIILEADEQTLTTRHNLRNDTQGVSFLKSRATKIRNIQEAPELIGRLEVRSILDESDLRTARDYLYKWFTTLP